MSSGQAYVGTAKRTFSHAVVHLLEASYRLLGSRRVLELIAQDVWYFINSCPLGHFTKSCPSDP